MKTDARQNDVTENVWRAVLWERFRGQPYPLCVFAEGSIPAASLWSGARLWLAAFREAGLTAGDRLVLALPPCPAFLQVLLAAFWEQLSLAVLPPGTDVQEAMERLDARACVGRHAGLACWQTDGTCLPESGSITLRPTVHPPLPEIRLLLCTSGTTGAPRWVALSDENLHSVLQSHRLPLALTEARTLSILPWHHAFGLIIDLLPNLLAGSEIVRDPSHGRDPESILTCAATHVSTHLSAVPLQVQKLASIGAGMAVLENLQGGVVGGAPVSAELATVLATTRLRAGYGQTEASPGIALGEPGNWSAHYLGRPLGCSVRLDADGQLLFQGRNACLGFWQADGFHALDPDRWHPTGDLVKQHGEDLYFCGRLDDNFKLANGRMVAAGRLETELKECFSCLQDVLLYSPDGEQLCLAVRVLSGQQMPARDAVRACLGALGSRLTQVDPADADLWAYTPKGTLARNQTRENLTRHGVANVCCTTPA